MNEKLRIASILITFLLAAYSMYAITFVLIPLHLSFNVSLAFITVAVTLSWIGGGIGGFIFGYISDIFGKKNTVLITILMYSISTILIFFINNFYQLYALMFFVGARLNNGIKNIKDANANMEPNNVNFITFLLNISVTFNFLCFPKLSLLKSGINNQEINENRDTIPVIKKTYLHAIVP